MDAKEARRYTGYNVHFNPDMNPKPSTSPPNQHWWKKLPSAPPPPININIQRQSSVTSETSSPVGSPISGSASPPAFGAINIDSKRHMPQPNVYKQFHFTQ